ncbi:MAG: hypothetical protein RIS47_1490 [Bacteroidota bacterium]|jgi:hypothetical protein
MKVSFYLYIALFAAALSACEDVVTIPLDEGDKKYVIDAYIESEGSPQATISQTQAYNNQASPLRIENAIVSITDAKTPSITVQLDKQTSPGVYTTTSPFAGTQGHVYELRVQIGTEVFTARDTLKRITPIDAIKVEKNANTDTRLSIKIDQQEPAGLGDQYRWIWYANGQTQLHPGFYATADDMLVDGNYISNLTIFNAEYSYGSFEYEIPHGAAVRIKVLSLSRPVFLYYQQLQMGSYGQNMFSPPPANAPGNIQGGALGFFRASAVSWSPETIYP